jgi:hypothetical protein
MNYSTAETCDDEDRQRKEWGPEASHPRSVAYGSFFWMRSYAVAVWTPTCQLLINGIIGMWPACEIRARREPETKAPSGPASPQRDSARLPKQVCGLLWCR